MPTAQHELAIRFINITRIIIVVVVAIIAIVVVINQHYVSLRHRRRWLNETVESRRVAGEN